jgi:hypothetical protein
MHHPEIYDIISTVEDYFLLRDSSSRFSIEPLIYIKQFGKLSDTNQPHKCQGIKISRQLNNGRVEINIFGRDRDDNLMDLQYFLDGNDTPSKVIEIIYSYDKKRQTSNIRFAVREIMILDRELSRANSLSGVTNSSLESIDKHDNSSISNIS